MGIDGVLFPFEEEEVKAEKKTAPVVKVAAKPRRGLMFMVEWVKFTNGLGLIRALENGKFMPTVTND
ncbi:FASCICLIN-like arabinogalactan protein 17 precursor [Prunus dulcis]|uniref:FASCICLIN-like arabinogalactan protein 17 n=1 Tax=Prunus dulcis TaxID=3755 RepID=A0A4Y1RUV8_PRUDU|nr:FASCICLIN-like arabinogalactan protein 17 precursor [Prunus dulcis]